MPVVEKLKGELSAFRLKVDDRTEVTPGFKFNDWELRGVPLRIEVGPKDVEKGSFAMARRDIPGRDGKILCSPGWCGKDCRRYAGHDTGWHFPESPRISAKTISLTRKPMTR